MLLHRSITESLLSLQTLFQILGLVFLGLGAPMIFSSNLMHMQFSHNEVLFTK